MLSLKTQKRIAKVRTLPFIYILLLKYATIAKYLSILFVKTADNYDI